jgi:hypothetical protein
VAFFRVRPDRPFEELAAMYARGNLVGKAAAVELQEALRAKACGMGADALIVMTETLWPAPDVNFSSMAVVAIRFRGGTATGP